MIFGWRYLWGLPKTHRYVVILMITITFSWFIHNCCMKIPIGIAKKWRYVDISMKILTFSWFLKIFDAFSWNMLDFGVQMVKLLIGIAENGNPRGYVRWIWEGIYHRYLLHRWQKGCFSPSYTSSTFTNHWFPMISVRLLGEATYRDWGKRYRYVDIFMKIHTFLWFLDEDTYRDWQKSTYTWKSCYRTARRWWKGPTQWMHTQWWWLYPPTVTTQWQNHKSSVTPPIMIQLAFPAGYGYHQMFIQRGCRRSSTILVQLIQ